MAETPPDKLMGWLTREEEEFGLTGTIERTLDADACRRLLEAELEYEPTEAQVSLMYEAARYKYEALPQVGVGISIYERPWGKQAVYTDILTGQFIGAGEVESRLYGIGYYD